MPTDHPVGLSPDWAVTARRLEHEMRPDVPYAWLGVRDGPQPLVPEVHDGIEVGVTLSGTAERHFEGHVVPGIPGDVWLCAMWEPHGRRVTSAHEENVVVIFLPQYLGEEMLGEIPWLAVFAVPPEQRPRVTAGEMRREVLTIGERMKREIIARRRGWPTALRLDLLRLLFLLSRDWDPPRTSGRKVIPSAGNLGRVMPALTLLHADGAHRVSLTEAAAACGLSRSRFSLIFGQAMGLSFSRFCLRARLAVAAERLATTDLSTEDIATHIGFVDASHLHRAFARHYACTPATYRRRARVVTAGGPSTSQSAPTPGEGPGRQN